MNSTKIEYYKKLLDVAYNEFTQELTRTLDKIAPIEEKKKLNGKNRPWYSNELLEQRKVTRKREKIYNTYKQEYQWKAFTRERNNYNRMLYFNKRHYLVTKKQRQPMTLKSYLR